MDTNELQQDIPRIRQLSEQYKSIWAKYKTAQVMQSTHAGITLSELHVLLGLISSMADELRYISYKCGLCERYPITYVNIHMDELIRNCPDTNDELKEELLNLYRIRDGC